MNWFTLTDHKRRNQLVDVKSVCLKTYTQPDMRVDLQDGDSAGVCLALAYNRAVFNRKISGGPMKSHFIQNIL